VIDSIVYDVSRFADLHPGGATVLHDLAGKESTDAFFGLHRYEVITKFGPRLIVGTIVNEMPRYGDAMKPGAISQVPYAEPMAWREAFKSPYFKDSHFALRKAVREFVDLYVAQEANECEATGKPISRELWKKMGDPQINLWAMRQGPGEHLKGRVLLGGVVKPEEFDQFHAMIIAQEFARLICFGANDGMGAGNAIGLPTVKNFANPELKKRVVDEVLSGEKIICLAITEAFAGSDTAGLKTTARLSDDGTHYIVNGTKKWITNSLTSDYFATACRNEGKPGFTMLLIERGEGVETKAIKTNYSAAAGTGYVTFENVKVPVSHRLGKEGEGQMVLLTNFNLERWLICVGANGMARRIVSECLKWANQRVVFGKKLIEQPVIQLKLGEMIAAVEADSAWLNELTYQITKMTYAETSKYLAGPIALLKFKCTRTSALVADNSVQILGGRGITQGGMGSKVAQFSTSFKFASVPGGSEEIMVSLGVRQAQKFFPKDEVL